ncbi:MAG: MazG family protein [Streptosporangiales bacterium]|nr:MazG family protein [Streptosporangiales bacterium]
MPGRLVFLATTHRVAPGLLSWRAWRALGEGQVLAASLDHPQVPYLSEAEITVRPVSARSSSPAELAGLLVEHAGTAGSPVVWLADVDGDEDLMRALGELVTADPDAAPEVEVVHGSYDLPGARLLDLVTTMDQLRRQCPWDRDQTHRSLAPHLLEEAYEAVEAIETDDLAALREELGDVLLQVAFHARIAEESDDDETHFSVDDVAAGIVDKLVRRHPHVFGDVEVSGAEEVKTNWEEIKRAEKRRSSAVEGIPLGQPALALAHALQRRAARAGVPDDLIASFARDGIGGELFAAVARSREQGVDPEAALRHVAREFRDRLLAVEEAGRAEGHNPSDLGPEKWRDRWRST